MKTTWRSLIENEMYAHGECLEDVIHSTITWREAEREIEIDGDNFELGGDEFFYIWTVRRVYCPWYDAGFDRKAVISLPRNPS